MTESAPKWLLPPRVSEAQQSALQVDSLLLAQLLWNRGVHAASAAASFLTPVSSTSDWGDPTTMLGAPEAARRLARAARAGERIAIYGDYDVDGLAGAAMLSRTLAAIGAQPYVHIPHRSRDGYGVHADAVRALAADSVKLVVTVDCGISADREVELAAQMGMEVIVTDHHTVPARLPSALAVLNPHQDECEYPFKDLAGGGVALQLCRLLLRTMLGREAEQALVPELAAFAALSTVADVVPLTGENRSIVGVGLAAARTGAVPGLAALCSRSGRRLGRLSARDLGFAVIPRLNAAGRMGDARDALDLLLATDPAVATDIAGRLETANSSRRALTDQILTSAAQESAEMAEAGAIVLAGAYPIGVAGLIAGRLAQRFGVPCVVIEQGTETSRGSARAGEGVHLVRALDDCSSVLLQYGGHARAAGFSLSSDNIDRFRAAFTAAMRAQQGAILTGPSLYADAQLRLSSVGHRLGALVERFEPVGAANPPPTFVSRGVTLLAVDQNESGSRRLRVAQGATVRGGVVFDRDVALPEPGADVDILFELDRSTWNGEERLDIIVRSAREST